MSTRPALGWVTAAVLAAACSSSAGRGTPSGGGGGDEGGMGGEPARTGGAGGTGGAAPGTGGLGGSSTGAAGGTGGDDAGAPDAGGTADAGAGAPPGVDPPVGQAETYTATALSPGTGQATDRRPISVGFHDARVNKTFVTWMGPGGSALVKAFDHGTQTWSPDKVAGKGTFSDSHNYPAMIRGKDDRLFIFYGCHNSPMQLAVSQDPLSIEGTWKNGTVAAAPAASYPAPIATSDGTMYVFIRLTRQKNGATDDRPFALVKSTDSGATWTKQTVIDNYPRNDNLTEIYNGKISYQPAHGTQKAKIHLAWTLAGGGSAGHHEHDAFTRNIYYAYLDPSNDHLYSIKGDDLGTTIDDMESETRARVLDTGCSNCAHQTGYQISVNYLDDGTPLILFGHYQNGLTSVRWDGSAWVSKVVTPGLGEPREINKIGPRSFQAMRTTGNTCLVYRTVDGGATWAMEATITAPHPVGRCHVLTNAHPDVKLFMEQNPDSGTGGTSTAKVTAGFVPTYVPGQSPATP
jgi:BNR repeat-containing family member